MIYINEAHAVDVWPIGLSAGTLNYSHKKIEDRSACALKFIQTFDFNIPIYLDTMSNAFAEEFSVWPFRYFIIKWSKTSNTFVFSFIPDPSESEFDITELIAKLE
jgi:hypothetical protein